MRNQFLTITAPGVDLIKRLQPIRVPKLFAADPTEKLDKDVELA